MARKIDLVINLYIDVLRFAFRCLLHLLLTTSYKILSRFNFLQNNEISKVYLYLKIIFILTKHIYFRIKTFVFKTWLIVYINKNNYIKVIVRYCQIHRFSWSLKNKSVDEDDFMVQAGTSHLSPICILLMINRSQFLWKVWC